jgi:hypothetical protein
MKFFGMLACAILAFGPACRNTTPPASTAPPAQPKNYFPVADFLRTEIQYVDSTPLAIRKYDSLGAKNDSSFIQAPEFNRLSQVFLPPELDSSYFETHFTESSFIDQTTHTVTFNYLSHDDSGALKRVDVVADQPPSGASRVKSVYLEEQRLSGDSTVTIKMIWKARKSFWYLQIVQHGNQAPGVKQLNVVWDDSE